MDKPVTATKKVYSAPLPLRAIYDNDLAGLDLRVLACVAYHDRMSLATGRGQGCWASHETLAAEIGCHYISLSKSLKKLGDLGYVERSKPTFGDKRQHVYQIPGHLYSREESESFGKLAQDAKAKAGSEKVSQPTISTEDLVSQGGQNSPVNSNGSHEQYISLSDVRYSAEAEKDIPLKGRIADAKRVLPDDPFVSGSETHAHLARLERALKADADSFSNELLITWSTWLAQQAEVWEGEDDKARFRAQRLEDAVGTILWERGVQGFGEDDLPAERA